MSEEDHPEFLFDKVMMLSKEVSTKKNQPNWDELISSVVTSSSSTYQTPFKTKMLEMDKEIDGQVVFRALKEFGNELHTAGSPNRTNNESAHEISLIQFLKGDNDNISGLK